MNKVDICKLIKRAQELGANHIEIDTRDGNVVVRLETHYKNTDLGTCTKPYVGPYGSGGEGRW